MSHAALQYRPEIDGMRAIAVLAVVVFHGFPETVPGGFIGVDVFFVISGYLISSIIFHDLDCGQFSLNDFYARRVRRVFPALTVVLASCLAIGWSILLPAEWHSLAKLEVASAGFASNLALAKEAGYFDAAQHSKPLLHLWSLGIEEQFYILWPLTLLVLWKFTPRLLLAIFLIGAVSFARNIEYFHRYPTGVFYHPDTRVWELLAGAALARFTALYGPVRSRLAAELLGAAGALLVALSLAMLNDTVPFPGWWALLPVLGTVLLIRAGSEAWLNRRLLSSRPFVFVGLISYPLYLWHWPLLVYLKLVNDSDYWLTPGRWVTARWAAIALAFVLSGVTWRFWETPMRSSKVLTSSFRVKVLVAMMGAAALMGVFSLRYVSPRLSSPAVMEMANARADVRFLKPNYKAPSFSVQEIPSAAKHATLLVGDSHMEHYMPRFETAIQADPRRASAVFAVYGGCPPLPGLNPTEPGFRCPAFYEYWTAKARQARFTTVVLSAFWEDYTIGIYGGQGPPAPPKLLAFEGRNPTEHDYDEAWRGLEVTLRSFVEAGKRVVIFTSSPASYILDPQIGFRRLGPFRLETFHSISRHGLEQFLAPLNGRLERVARNSGAEIVNPLDSLCRGDECPAVEEDGSPIYRDGQHLRASKVVNLASFVDDVLRP